MSDLTTAKDRAKNAPPSKDVPWFHSKIGSSLSREGRRLLEDYSGIASKDVESHIYRIRDIAWDIFPWPCIGEFWFVTLGLVHHPSYATLLARLRSPTSPARLLDLGTCMGQDVRKLMADGVPSDNLYGSDLSAEFEAVGHELFRDSNTFAGHFITADLFDDADESELVKTRGTWDVVNIIMVLHLWDWDTQIAACKRILKLLSPKPGSLIIGAQTASTQPGDFVLKPPFVAEGEERNLYRQSLETFKKMWEIVKEDEGIELKVNVQYDDQTSRNALVKEEEEGERNSFFKQTPEERKLFFTIERS